MLLDRKTVKTFYEMNQLIKTIHQEYIIKNNYILPSISLDTNIADYTIFELTSDDMVSLNVFSNIKIDSMRVFEYFKLHKKKDTYLYLSDNKAYLSKLSKETNTYIGNSIDTITSDKIIMNKFVSLLNSIDKQDCVRLSYDAIIDLINNVRIKLDIFNTSVIISRQLTPRLKENDEVSLYIFPNDNKELNTLLVRILRPSFNTITNSFYTIVPY